MAEIGRIMPAFIFVRRRDIEIETGLVLAGSLIVDLPKQTKPKRRHRRMVAELMQRFIAEAQAGRMPDDAIVYGWPNGQRPADADETIDNDELMTSWAKTRIVIAVRIDPRNDSMIRIDSDLLR